MYDAKQKEEEKDQSLLYNTIYDRSYFDKVKSDAVLSTKTAYIPSETLGLE